MLYALSVCGLLCPASRVGALSDDARLTSVAFIGPKSRTERRKKTKIGTEVAHVARDSDTKGQLAGGGAYCGGLPHSLFVWLCVRAGTVTWCRTRSPVRSWVVCARSAACWSLPCLCPSSCPTSAASITRASAPTNEKLNRSVYKINITL